MASYAKKSVATLFAGAVLAVGIAAPASAQPRQDGLVNVNLENIEILNDVNIGVAAQIAAEVCGLSVGPVAVLATEVDRTGMDRTVCTTDQGPVTFFQN